MNPIFKLKYQPWGPMLQVAALTTGIVFLLELLIQFAVKQFPPFAVITGILYGGMLGVIFPLFTALAVGVGAIYVLEWRYQQFYVETATLWTLIACFLLTLWIKNYLPVESYLIGCCGNQLALLTVGIFWKARPYFKYSGRRYSKRRY